MMHTLFPHHWPSHHLSHPPNTHPTPTTNDPGLTAGLQLLRSVSPTLLQDGNFRHFQQKILFPHIWNVREEAARTAAYNHQASLLAEQQRINAELKKEAGRLEGERKKAEEGRKKVEGEKAAEEKRKREKEEMLRVAREEVTADMRRAISSPTDWMGGAGMAPWGPNGMFGAPPPSLGEGGRASKKKGYGKKKNDKGFPVKRCDVLEKIVKLCLDDSDEDEDGEEDDCTEVEDEWDLMREWLRQKQARDHVRAAFGQAGLGLNLDV